MDALIIRRALFEPFDKTQDKLRELARPPCLASISFHEAGRGVNGFGYFCRNKKPALSLSKGGSAAGPKPGNTEKHYDTGVWKNKGRIIRQPTVLKWKISKYISDRHHIAVRLEPYILYDPP